MLARSLAPDSDWAPTTTADLLTMLPRTQDYLAREAIARALAALAPKLPRRPAQGGARGREEWTCSGPFHRGSDRVGAARSPALLRKLGAATTEIVEALKDPTVTGAPADILLAALKRSLGKGTTKPSQAGRLPDGIVLDLLEKISQWALISPTHPHHRPA